MNKDTNSRIEWLERKINQDTGDDTSAHLIDLMAEHYDRLPRETDTILNFGDAVQSSEDEIRSLFVERVKRGDALFALTLFRAKPQTIGARLFNEHYRSLFKLALSTESEMSLYLLWPYVPIKTRNLFVALDLAPTG